MNADSSRSHYIFRLRVIGHNAKTGVKCDGELNLVDLAGSERVKDSGVTGDAMKEAQCINKVPPRLLMRCPRHGSPIDHRSRRSFETPHTWYHTTHLAPHRTASHRIAHHSPLRQPYPLLYHP